MMQNSEHLKVPLLHICYQMIIWRKFRNDYSRVDKTDTSALGSRKKISKVDWLLPQRLSSRAVL